MRDEENPPLTSDAGLIRAERHAVKLLQDAGFSEAQAEHIRQTGRVPATGRERFIAFLKRLRDRGQERVKALDEEILLLEYRVAREEARAAAALAADRRRARPADPQARGAESLALSEGER